MIPRCKLSLGHEEPDEARTYGRKKTSTQVEKIGFARFFRLSSLFRSQYQVDDAR